jgi:2-polyprenyl-3-methyl-5-hydroxy-6-metoxy-1,4-benzoquinol methylase
MLNNLVFKRLQKIEEPIEKLNTEQKLALSNFTNKLNNNLYSFEEISCLCGSKNSLIIGKKDRYALNVQTHLCKDCGMMWTSPRMSEDSLAEFYECDYRPIYVGEEKAPEDFFNEQIKHGEYILNFIEIEKTKLKNFKVFDVGCGAGGILMPFKKIGCSTIGCDLGSKYLEKGRQEGLILEHGATSVLKKYDRADLVILSHVLEHFSNPLKNLLEISEIINNSGYLYIELPGILKIHQSYQDTLLFLQNAHLYHFTLSTLTSLMSKAGFRLVKGDEYIHALFQKDINLTPAQSQNQFYKVILYLYFVELERRFKIFFAFLLIKNEIIRIVKVLFGESLVNKLKKYSKQKHIRIS